MSLSDLASLGSFVNGLAVLASLIYLAVQVRQAERYQKAIAQQARAARLAESSFRTAEMAEVYDKGVKGDEISPTQFAQFRHIMFARLQNAEDTFRLHEIGLIGDDVFDGFCSQMRLMASQAGWRAMWNQLAVSKGKEFRAFIEQTIAKAPVATPTDDFADWRAAVAAERNKSVKA